MKAIILFLVTLLFAGYALGSGVSEQSLAVSLANKDSVGAVHFRKFFRDRKSVRNLNFPMTTKRIYEARGYTFSWLNSGNNQRNLWEAMLALDCVKLYGLDRARYHPDEVSYGILESILKDSVGDNTALRVKTDVLLTDAVISFLAHLHYGIENPYFSTSRIDRGKSDILKLDSVLLSALDSDFRVRLLAVQPSSKAYTDLQQYMEMTVGQQAGDCFQTPEDDFKLMAINLERLRWNPGRGSIQSTINIPSATITFTEGEMSSAFSVKPWQTLDVRRPFWGYIRELQTSPEWLVPDIIFQEELLRPILANPDYLSENNYSIYSKGGRYIWPSPKNLSRVRSNPAKYKLIKAEGVTNPLGQVIFKLATEHAILYGSRENNTALLRYAGRLPGAVLIESPEEFIIKLLKADGAAAEVISQIFDSMTAYQKYKYQLKNPIPVYLSYQTCGIEEGLMVAYPDTHNLDTALKERIFGKAKFKTWTD